MLPRNGWQFVGIFVFVLTLLAAATLWLFFTNCSPLLRPCSANSPCTDVCGRNHAIAIGLVIAGGLLAVVLGAIGSFLARRRNQPHS